MDQSTGGVRFCHDGTNTDVQSIEPTRVTVIHPCYWRGLDLNDEAPEHDIVVNLDDEDDVVTTQAVKANVSDMRLRKLGTVIAELGTIPLGNAGAHTFEGWVYDATRYLFAKGLDNIAPEAN